MFANFELWSGGMVEHTAPARRHPRSNRACVACHRGKRKCDAQEPACGRCRRKGRSRCTWWSRPAASPSASPESSSASPITSPQPREEGALQKRPAWSSREQHVSVLPLTQGQEMPHSYAYPSPLAPMQPNASALVPRIKGISGGHTWDLIRQANHPLHSVYIDDHYSLLVPLLPLMLEFAPYAHAWAALGAAYIAQLDPSQGSTWRETAMRCYSEAICGLCSHLQSTAVPHEWALCAVLLLHVFEKFGSIEQPPSRAHVQSMRTVFVRRFMACPPTSLRHILELESLVYRLAVTSTFRRGDDDILSDEEYGSLDELVRYWVSSDITRGMWQHSLLLSLPPTLFNTVFKLSLLLRQWPLDMPWQGKLQCQQQALQQLSPFYTSSLKGSFDIATVDDGIHLSLAEQTYAAHSLYWYACQLIITRLGQTETYCTGISQNARNGLDLLHQLNTRNFVSLILMWPATIIGLAAATEHDQQVVTTYIRRAEHLSGSRTTASVTRLLHLAWGSDNPRLRSINALLDNQAVRGVYL